jgi:hypothetical protein
MIASMTLIDEPCGNHYFNLTIKAHRIFGAAINLGRLFLMAESHDVGHVYARNANLPQRLLDFFEFEWLNDGDDAFDGITPGGGLGFTLVHRNIVKTRNVSIKNVPCSRSIIS